MNFQNLGKIEDHQFYLDVAFRYAKEKASLSKEKINKKARRDNVKKKKMHEQIKLRAFETSLTNKFNKILESFPSVDALPKFYVELIKVTIDYVQLKKSLGALNWAVKKLKEMASIYEKKVMKSADEERVTKAMGEFYGRMSSIVKQVKKNLTFLEQSRRTMKSFPNVKTSVFSVGIFGFPNTGKTTLLYRLTGSKPEINSYAFTTKNINIGYFKDEGKKVQVIDTPGTLNRFDKMNFMEKQAYLCLKYCADLVIYVFDITEPFPLRQQKKLLLNIKDKDIIVYLSKKDIIDKDTFDSFKKKDYYDSATEIKKEILRRFTPPRP